MEAVILVLNKYLNGPINDKALLYNMKFISYCEKKVVAGVT